MKKGSGMDSETERLIARIITERAALLDQRALTDGVLSFLRRPPPQLLGAPALFSHQSSARPRTSRLRHYTSPAASSWWPLTALGRIGQGASRR